MFASSVIDLHSIESWHSAFAEILKQLKIIRHLFRNAGIREPENLLRW